jgi:hypothetical protein
MRLSQLRRDADTALARTEQLEAQVEALRRELAATTIAVGDQLAALSAVVERLERESTGAPDDEPE